MSASPTPPGASRNAPSDTGLAGPPADRQRDARGLRTASEIGDKGGLAFSIRSTEGRYTAALLAAIRKQNRQGCRDAGINARLSVPDQQNDPATHFSFLEHHQRNLSRMRTWLCICECL